MSDIRFYVKSLVNSILHIYNSSLVFYIIYIIGHKIKSREFFINKVDHKILLLSSLNEQLQTDVLTFSSVPDIIEEIRNDKFYCLKFYEIL